MHVRETDFQISLLNFGTISGGKTVRKMVKQT